MSVEKVKAFFAKAAEDKDLQKKLKTLAKREEALYADLAKMASKAGFKFTTADARKARIAAARKLSEKELDAVAGGIVGEVSRSPSLYFAPGTYSLGEWGKALR